MNLQAQQALSAFQVNTSETSGVSYGQINGRVSDAESGDVLTAATVHLSDPDKTVFTDEGGHFSFHDLAPGNYDIQVSYLGYQSALKEKVYVHDGQTLKLSFGLTPSAMEVEEIVVTASSRSQAIKLAPASVGVISSRQIQERNIQTFDQAFDEMAGVIVTRSGNANVQAFSIRGASEVAGGGIGNRVLLLIDGRPALSPESGGALWNLVPMGSIERIEVVRGAYSSLYGSSAMGGVVNIITKNPAPDQETRVQLNYGAYEGSQTGNYHRYNDFNDIAVSHSRRLGKFAYLLDGSWRANDGHKEKAGFELLNFFGKASWDFSSKQHLQLSLNSNEIWNDTPASWLSFRQPYEVAAYRKDDYQNRREFNADLYYYALPTDWLKYSNRLYLYTNHSRFTFDDDPGNDSTNVNTGKQLIAESSVLCKRLGNITQVDLYTGWGHNFVAGLDLHWDYVLGEPDTVLYGEHRSYGAGIYLQDEFVLSKKLSATAGVRFDDFRISTDVKSQNLSPKLALLYKAHSRLSLRMLLAQAFRDPPIAERYIKFEQGGGLSFMPNPALKSERLIVSAEIGAKFSPGKGSTLDVAFFYNRYNNLISFLQIPNPAGNLVYQVVNLKEALMQGIEISYQQSWGQFLILNAFYTFLDARDQSEGRLNDALAYKVKHSVGFGATTRFRRFCLNLNGRYRSKIEEVFIYPGSEPGATYVVNTKLCYKLPSGKYSAYLAVNNLTNTQYEELERYRMPGRCYTLGVDMRF
ncbi:MAG: TonB-dependent receptor [Saprospiraceae bacterium]